MRLGERFFQAISRSIASSRSSIPPVASSPGTAARAASYSRCRAPTIRVRANLRVLESGWQVSGLLARGSPCPVSPGPEACHATPTTPTRRRFNTTSTASLSNGRAASPSLRGRLQNGMSNNFPQGLARRQVDRLRPDTHGLLNASRQQVVHRSRDGGKARPAARNLWRMNSWHSFSPNGTVAGVFIEDVAPHIRGSISPTSTKTETIARQYSSKTTAANRAVNIPEFVNIPKGGLEPHRNSRH